MRIHIDGAVRSDGVLEDKGISWIPSVGWEFNRDSDTDSDPTGWKSVSVYALQDDDNENESVRFTHELWDENDNCPFPHGEPEVKVAVTDDDVPGITVSPSRLTMPEEGSNTYTVKLNTEPTSMVMVSVNVPSGTDVSVDPSSLIFIYG